MQQGYFTAIPGGCQMSGPEGIIPAAVEKMTFVNENECHIVFIPERRIQ